jgi:hypothetical protein
MLENTEFPAADSSMEVDFEALDEDLMANDPYWSPVRKDDLGSFGPAEMITAAANFLDVGDVGNADWMAARNLPFRDQELDEIGVTGRLLMRYAYEDHPDHEFKPRSYDMLEGPEVKQAYEDRWLDNDPSVKWAIQEANLLLGSESELSPVQNKRLESLVQFVMESRNYHQQQHEEQFVAVPEWALDTLTYSAELGMEYDPKIIPEPGQVSALKSKPISFSPLPSPTDIRKYFDIYEPEEIKTNTREWCFRIKDGVKQYGPYGVKAGQLTMYRSPNRDFAFQCKTFREASTLSWLHEHGFQTTEVEGDIKLQLAQEVTPDNLKAMTMLYGQMAQNIASAAATCSILFTKRDEIERSLKKEAFQQVSQKVMVTHPYQDQDITVLKCLKLKTNKKKWELSWQDAKDNLPPEVCDILVNKIMTKIGTRTYLLQIRSKTGYDTVQITKDDELAKEWRIASPEDIPYFMSDPQTRDRLGRPSSLKPDHYDSLPPEDQEAYDVLHQACVDSWLEETGLTQERLQSLVKGFNSAHKTKTIPSRIERSTGYLLDDLPATTAQLALQRQALALLGDKIVKCRISLTRTDETRRMAFRKLQGALKSRILAGALTKGSLERIVQGQLALSYKFRQAPMPKDPNEVQKLTTQGVIYGYEQGQNHYVQVLVETNKTFLNHAEVFSIVPNFKPNAEVKKMAAIALERELYIE